MYAARIIVACVAGFSVLFGALLVALDLTGTLEWKGRLPGGELEVKSTHVGIAFAIVGMTIAITVIRNPAVQKTTTTRKLSHSEAQHAPPRQAASGPEERSTSGPARETVVTEETTYSARTSSAGAAIEPRDPPKELEQLSELLADPGMPEDERAALMRRLLDGRK